MTWRSLIVELINIWEQYSHCILVLASPMAQECSFSMEDLLCSVCCEVFDTPVILSCKHSFCKTCIQTHWDRMGTRQCPLCRCTERSTRPPINMRERKTAMVREKLQEVNKSIEELSDIIRYIEPIKIADNLTFLKVNVHLKHYYYVKVCHVTSVNFDPNTAHPNLIISDELTSISYGKKQQLPDNPERCTSSMAVLAANSFDSGKQRWFVEVAYSKEWYIGVARESIKRKTAVFLNPKEGFWVISNNEESYWAQTSPRTRLTLKKTPQIITVELDYDKGKVSFSDSADGGSIYTFKDKFTERIFPYFATGIKEGNTLRICAF
uniref:Uncharacterized protein n=1 Tax=Cyprinus carpio TaxID=7962 RepID=A0A8C1MRE0_CYPCA